MPITLEVFVVTTEQTQLTGRQQSLSLALGIGSSQTLSSPQRGSQRRLHASSGQQMCISEKRCETILGRQYLSNILVLFSVYIGIE